ncbi:MAG: hypothetical protein HC875_14855 [Anaerolineales bacterium]|nr:hypothetical protein [Anaerolineales bacterium]
MQNNSPRDISSKRIGLPILIIAAVLYGLLLIPWVVLAGLLVLSFTPLDTPFAYLTICAYPLLVIGCLVAGFVLYRKNHYRAAILVIPIPLIDVCLLFIAYALIWP